ncbi:hypothetical protein MSG28_006327 [Choristoneura fumiferana]|uniref:Uncharacterized protein n=2 Tax=Choristoneura fumiferana TaxID=7141 RepID=A0ACC0JEK6_CHOFU|nr:hypothetical protein MSG28_006327 [Choristoneura fumiferana]KAI8422516.1 hypothetical protein MSG28_006327 [Choristoneura fumiferana]
MQYAMYLMPELSFQALLKLSSFLFWTWLYFWFKYKVPEKSPEFYSRAITLVHGSVATVSGLIQCDIGNICLHRFTTPILLSHYLLMIWSWGYFAFDLLWCLLYWRESKLILFHHFCSILAIDFYMQKEQTGCTFSCTLALMEVTNPLLQTRWFLRNMGLEQSKIFLLVEVLYFVSFLVVRGMLGSYLLMKIITLDTFGIDQKAIAIGLYIISAALIWEILSYVLHKYKNKLGKFRSFLSEMGIILDEQI